VFKKIFVVGIPFAAEQMFFNGGKLLTQTFISRAGGLDININTVASSVNGVSTILGNSISLCAITVIGQCIGNSDIDGAKKITKSFLNLSSITVIISGIIILPLLPFLTGLFHPMPEGIIKIYGLVIASTIWQVFFWSGSFLFPSVFRAAGDSKYTTIVSMLSMWLFRVALGFVLSTIFHLGVIGVWVAMMLEWAIRNAIFSHRFKTSKWYEHKLID
jgi:Na+-driven multidrug efflux pump